MKISQILLTCISILVLFSCETDLPENSIPDDAPRIDDIGEQFKQQLVAAEYGWKISYKPDSLFGAFLILMNFKENETLTIQSDLNGFHEEQSSVYYRTDGLSYPVLVFETFCIWHHLYDIALGNYQFRIIASNDNQILLSTTGDNFADLILEKASANDYNLIKKHQEFDKGLTEFYDAEEKLLKTLTISSETEHKILAYIDTDYHVISLTYPQESGDYTFGDFPFYYTENGLKLYEPLKIGTFETDEFQFDTFQDSTLISLLINSQPSQIIAEDKPSFQIPGTEELLRNSSFYQIVDYSPDIKYLDDSIQAAGEYSAVQLYIDYDLGAGSTFNTLSFLIYKTYADYDFYNFFVREFQFTDENKLRMIWTGEDSENVDGDLLSILHPMVVYMFHKTGFTVVPYGGYFIFISNADSKKYFIAMPGN